MTLLLTLIGLAILETALGYIGHALIAIGLLDETELPVSRPEQLDYGIRYGHLICK